MRETTVEKYLRKRITDIGGLCLKFTSPGYNGMPDRIVLLDGGFMLFVEVKAPGEKPEDHQDRVHSVLRGLGFYVVTVDSHSAVDMLVSQIIHKDYRSEI